MCMVHCYNVFPTLHEGDAVAPTLRFSSLALLPALSIGLVLLAASCRLGESLDSFTEGPIVDSGTFGTDAHDSGDDLGSQATDSCVPTTCAKQAAVCGTIADHCGATLHCGDCPDGEVCGAAGPNQCGCACSLPHADTLCIDGNCSIGQCHDGWKDCDNDPLTGCEVNPSVHPDHCGQCDAPCPPATPVCSSGQCEPSNCPPNTGDCAPDVPGCETDLLTSVKHCGFCGNDCALANATASCNQGKCVIASCSAGFEDCDADPATGCEIPLGTVANCKSCGDACAPSTSCRDAACGADGCTYVNVPNGTKCDTSYCDGNTHITRTCSNGTCVQSTTGCSDFEVCVGGYGCRCGQTSDYCLGTDVNYCCTNGPSGCFNVSNNAYHCGHDCLSCGVNAYCTGGACACQAGWADCNDSWSDGCESDLSRPQTCGSCFLNCQLSPEPGGGNACVSGMCGCNTSQDCDYGQKCIGHHCEIFP